MNEVTPAAAQESDLMSVVAPQVSTGPVSFSGDIAKLFAALARAQAKIGVAHKKSNNPAFKAKYADLSQVWDAIQDALPGEELCLIQMPHTEGKRVSLTTMIGHSSGAWISCMTSLTVRDEGAHAVGGGITYLRRYSAAAMTGVVQADDDGNAAQGRTETQQRAPVGSMREEAARLTGQQREPDERTEPPATFPMIAPDGAEYQIGKGKAGPAHLVWLAAWKSALARLGSPEEIGRWAAANKANLALVGRHFPDIARAAEMAKEDRAEEVDFPGDRMSRDEMAGAK